MAGPAWGPAFVQGQAAGFQGQNLGIEQLLQQLRVAAAQKQFQDAEEAKQAQGGGYAAILSMLGGAGAPPAALPVSPAPGTNSATAPRAATPAGLMPAPEGQGRGLAVPQLPAGAVEGYTDPATRRTFTGGDAADPTAWTEQEAAAAPQPLPGASPARQVLEGRPQVTAPQMAAPGSMGLPQLIQAVERSMPGAPPQVKMLALEKLSGVMNEQAKVEFARMEHMFNMNMEIAKLTELAQNHFQMSLDRNASVAQRAQAAREHQQTLLALGQLTAAVRREADDTRNARHGDRMKLEYVKEDDRNARAAAHDRTRITVADINGSLRERLAGLGKLTPEQQLLRNQSNQLARQYGAVVAAAGANSKQAKLLEGQLQALNQRIEGTLQAPAQPGAAAPQQPVQPTPQTTPLPPQKGDVRDGWRFKGGDPADRANWEPAK